MLSSALSFILSSLGRDSTKGEYIFPLNDSTKSVGLFADPITKDPGLPGVGRSSTLRPRMKWMPTYFVSS